MNGIEGMHFVEITLMYNAAKRALNGVGIEIVRSLISINVTFLDIAGYAVTLPLRDGEMLKQWTAPVLRAAKKIEYPISHPSSSNLWPIFKRKILKLAGVSPAVFFNRTAYITPKFERDIGAFFTFPQP